jgi:hypothetical protein
MTSRKASGCMKFRKSWRHHESKRKQAKQKMKLERKERERKKSIKIKNRKEEVSRFDNQSIMPSITLSNGESKPFNAYIIKKYSS